MSRDFFKYLKDLDKEQSYWFAPGSLRYVWKTEISRQKRKRRAIMCLQLFYMKVTIIHIRLSKNGEKFMERNFRSSQGYKLES